MWYSPGYHQYSTCKLFSAPNSFPVEAKHTIRWIASQLLHLLVVDAELEVPVNIRLSNPLNRGS